jgi:hypothetical protein
MECPICGKDCEGEFEVIEVRSTPMEDMADYLFEGLIEKGYVVNYDNINMILEMINDYMMQNGDVYTDDDEEECS